MLEEIVLTEDQLRQLEKQFGPAVRLMGSWNSDGTFGYAGIPLCAVMRAAEALPKQDAIPDLAQLRNMPERTTAFLRLMDTFGSPLIAAIGAAYQECSTAWVRSSPKPANAAGTKALVRTAAA